MSKECNCPEPSYAYALGEPDETGAIIACTKCDNMMFLPIEELEEFKKHFPNLPKYEDKVQGKKELNESPFTQLEQNVWDLITQAHNSYLELQQKEGHGHPFATADWASGIHSLQNVLEHRVMKRLFPKTIR